MLHSSDQGMPKDNDLAGFPKYDDLEKLIPTEQLPTFQETVKGYEAQWKLAYRAACNARSSLAVCPTAIINFDKS